MYSVAKASFIKQKFWTSFGMYMSPVPSATLEKVNWINYKTGIKGISFKLNADKDSVSVVVEIFLKDTMLQHQYFETFNNFASELKKVGVNNWNFQKDYFQENKGSVSLILAGLKNVNIFKEPDWPTMISFLKQYMLGLDKFWASYKPAFELL